MTTEQQHEIHADAFEAYRGMAEAKILELIEERSRLLAGFAEIREIYAGMEGFKTETAPEGYQQMIIKQMWEVAREVIKEK